MSLLQSCKEFDIIASTEYEYNRKKVQTAGEAAESNYNFTKLTSDQKLKFVFSDIKAEQEKEIEKNVQLKSIRDYHLERKKNKLKNMFTWSWK